MKHKNHINIVYFNLNSNYKVWCTKDFPVYCLHWLQSLSHVCTAFCALCTITAKSGVFMNFQTKEDTVYLKVTQNGNLVHNLFDIVPVICNYHLSVTSKSQCNKFNAVCTANRKSQRGQQMGLHKLPVTRASTQSIVRIVQIICITPHKWQKKEIQERWFYARRNYCNHRRCCGGEQDKIPKYV
jgi:hypothetical protein